MGAKMMGKHSSNMLEKSVKGKMFGPRMNEVIGKLEKLNEEEI
jgi:hypothetical protein